MDNWLSTDEALEAVFSLEMVCDQLPKATDNPFYWKWVIIALHKALQGYMVLALRGSNSINVLTKKCAQEWMDARRKRSEVFPESRLDSFFNLYKKIQTGRKTYDQWKAKGGLLRRKNGDLMLMYGDSQPFEPQGTQTESVKMLNGLRNELIHFLPKSWVLDIGDLPRMVTDCIDIIAFLVFDCGNILWYDQSQKHRTETLIDKIKTELQQLCDCQ
jgi:hypothetical protein